MSPPPGRARARSTKTALDLPRAGRRCCRGPDLGLRSSCSSEPRINRPPRTPTRAQAMPRAALTGGARRARLFSAPEPGGGKRGRAAPPSRMPGALLSQLTACVTPDLSPRPPSCSDPHGHRQLQNCSRPRIGDRGLRPRLRAGTKAFRDSCWRFCREQRFCRQAWGRMAGSSPETGERWAGFPGPQSGPVPARSLQRSSGPPGRCPDSHQRLRKGKTKHPPANGLVRVPRAGRGSKRSLGLWLHPPAAPGVFTEPARRGSCAGAAGRGVCGQQTVCRAALSLAFVTLTVLLILEDKATRGGGRGSEGTLNPRESRPPSPPSLAPSTLPGPGWAAGRSGVPWTGCPQAVRSCLPTMPSTGPAVDAGAGHRSPGSDRHVRSGASPAQVPATSRTHTWPQGARRCGPTCHQNWR
ncbi:uncharacterized protein LOC123382935 [Felis catus]|uniref:uncharacterized protein LOC123382935 n=1 Tax=Felis catus TaxID=9685 RepID=UPI001D19BE18|nr:uncharacterized protein LOC123382935 [Felis catus]